MKFSKWVFAYFLLYASLTTATIFLTGCGVSNNTKNLTMKDENLKSLALSAQYKATDLVGVSANVTSLSGNSSERFDARFGEEIDNDEDGEPDQRLEAVQINGMRFLASESDPLDLTYDFDLNVSTLLMDFYTVRGDKYKLTLSPGLSYTQYSVDVDVLNQRLNIDDDVLQFGMQIRQDFKILEKLNASLDIGIFGGSDQSLVSSKATLDYKLTDHVNLFTGYQYTSFGSRDTDNSDGCSATDLSNECEDSELFMSTQGLILGLEVVF